jgi:hypothetical protein
MKKIILILTAILSVSIGLIAQETTSEIQGTITTSNQKLAGAIITATHKPSGTVYKTTTREDGRYNLPNLKIGGPYNLTVSYLGYKEVSQDDIILEVGQSFKQNFNVVATSTSLKDVIVKSTNDKIFNKRYITCIYD